MCGLPPHSRGAGKDPRMTLVAPGPADRDVELRLPRGSAVAQRDLVRLRNAVGLDSSQPLTQALTGLPQQLERVDGRALRGSPIQLGAVLLDQVRLKRRSDLIGRLQRMIDGPVPRRVVNHAPSIPADGFTHPVDPRRGKLPDY